MSYPIRQQLTSVLCMVLLIVTPAFITSCSDGVGGIAAATLSLSKSSVSPGEMITLFSKAIIQGGAVQATFRGDNGYEVVVELLDTQDGSARVMVPPYFDPATGIFQAGTVSVSISGVVEERSLKIGNLPDTGEIEPGEILRAVLEVAIESYEFNLINIDTIDAELGGAVDPSPATTAINDQIAALQAMLDELDATGQITVDLGDGQTAALGSNELKIADQILLAFFGQMASKNLLDKPLVTLRRIDECLKLSSEEQINACIYEVFDGIRRDTGIGTKYGSMLMTFGGLAILAGGLYFGAAPVAIFGLFTTVLGGAASFSNAAVNEQNTDAFLNNNGQGFNASQETASQSVRVMSGLASNLPGPPGAIAGATSVGLAVRDLVDGVVTEKCRTEDGSNQRSTGDVAEFCTVVLGGGSSPDANGDYDDDDDTDGNIPDDSTPVGTFTILNYMNIDGSMGSGAAGANISLSGSEAMPTISWSVSNVFSVSVTSGSSALYGIQGERMDSEGDLEQIPFAFSSVTYGDYGRSNTAPMEGVASVAPALQSGPYYSIMIGTLDGKFAVLNFMIGS